MVVYLPSPLTQKSVLASFLKGGSEDILSVSGLKAGIPEGSRDVPREPETRCTAVGLSIFWRPVRPLGRLAGRLRVALTLMILARAQATGSKTGLSTSTTGSRLPRCMPRVRPSRPLLRNRCLKARRPCRFPPGNEAWDPVLSRSTPVDEIVEPACRDHAQR